MDWSAIIYAALGGGLGGAFGQFIGRLMNKDGTKKTLIGVITAVTVIVGYQGSNFLYKNMMLPRIIPLDSKELIESLPVLEFIQAQNPTVFKELIYPIDKAVRNNNITQDTLNEFRKTYGAVLETKKKTASIENLKAEQEVATELFKIMKNKSPIVCTQKLHGRPYGNVSKLVTQEYIVQEQQVMARFFTDKSRDTKVIPDKEAGKNLVTMMTQKIIAELKITNLDPSAEDLIENKKICDFQIELNSEIKKLNDKDFLDVYEFAFSL